jgi:hypothetical protein
MSSSENVSKRIDKFIEGGKLWIRNGTATHTPCDVAWVVKCTVASGYDDHYDHLGLVMARRPVLLSSINKAAEPMSAALLYA